MLTKTLSLLLLSMMTASVALSQDTKPVSSPWVETSFAGERAYEAASGEQTAIVSVSRCRLLYLGAADHSNNLLSAPATAQTPDTENQAPNWGGHRFWLGPQLRWTWPPLTDWEFSAAASVSCTGDTLTLVHPHTEAAYPALTREYAWEGTRLRCTIRWKDNGKAYYGMHVVAVDAPAQLSLALHPELAAPEGVLAIRIDGFDTKGVEQHPAVSMAPDHATLSVKSGSEKSAKLGVLPQTLCCERSGGWTLRMHPGPSTGVAIGASDAGRLTQVWVGQAHVPFAELEQLSPLLLGDQTGTCSSTCYLEAVLAQP